jgi:hypothetical protein
MSDAKTEALQAEVATLRATVYEMDSKARVLGHLTDAKATRAPEHSSNILFSGLRAMETYTTDVYNWAEGVHRHATLARTYLTAALYRRKDRALSSIVTSTRAIARAALKSATAVMKSDNMNDGENLDAVCSSLSVLRAFTVADIPPECITMALVLNDVHRPVEKDCLKTFGAAVLGYSNAYDVIDMQKADPETVPEWFTPIATYADKINASWVVFHKEGPVIRWLKQYEDEDGENTNE